MDYATAQTCAQMFVTLIAIWLGAALGPRRALLMGASLSVRDDLPADAVLFDLADAVGHAISGRAR